MKSSLLVIVVSHMLPEFVPWSDLVSAFVVVFTIAILWLRHQVRKRRACWTHDRLQELEAYCRFEAELPSNGRSPEIEWQARRICQLVHQRSAFSHIALLLLDAGGRMACVGSCGMDDLALAALDVLAGQLLRDESNGIDKAPPSFPVFLAEWADADAAPGCAEATIVPLRLQGGTLVGVLAVCADARMQRRVDLAQRTVGLPVAAMPLQMLGAKLGQILNQGRMVERLRQVGQRETDAQPALDADAEGGSELVTVASYSYAEIKCA